MRKPLSILILALFIIPLIPLITTPTVKANPVTTVALDTHPSYKTYKERVVYRPNISEYLSIWINETDPDYDEGPIYVAFVTPSGPIDSGPTKATLVDVKTWDSMPTVGTDYGVAIAYTYWGGSSSMHDIGMIIVYDDGTIDFKGSTTYPSNEHQEHPELAYNSTGNVFGLLYYSDGKAWIRLYNETSDSWTYSSDIASAGSYQYYRSDMIFVKKYFVAAIKCSNDGTNYNLTIYTIDSSRSVVDSYQVVTNVPVYGTPYMAYLESADKILLVWTQGDSSNDIKGLIFEVGDDGTITVDTALDIDTRADDAGYPYPVAGANKWLVIWEKTSGNDDVRARLVSPDGTMSNIIDVASDIDYGETMVRSIYDPSTGDFAVFYERVPVTGGQGDVYAVRIDEDNAYISSSASLILSSTESEVPQYLATDGNGQIALAYRSYEASDSDAHLALLDITEINAPSEERYLLTETRIIFDSFGDTSGDGYIVVGSGEQIHLTAHLEFYNETSGNYEPLTVSDQPIEVQLERALSWNYTHESYIVVSTTTVYTDANGAIDVYLDIPSDALSGLYVVKLIYAGNATLGYDQSENWIDAYGEQTGFAPVSVLPADTTKTIDGGLSDWSTLPISIGPAILYSNGELAILDAKGDIRNETNEIAGEEDDADILQLRLAFDSNYLYVAYEVAGNAGNDGNVAPAVAIAFDFTPDNPDDGAQSDSSHNFRLFYHIIANTYSASDRLKRIDGTESGWDVIVFITPVLYKYSNFGYSVTPKVAIVHVWDSVSGGNYDYCTLLAGKVVFNGGIVEAAIPLDIIGYAYAHDKTQNIFADKGMAIYNALYMVNTTSGYLVQPNGRDDGLLYDLAGILLDPALGGTPPTQALTTTGVFSESWVDHEIDSRFIVNVDNTGKFYGYTIAYITATNVTVGGNTYFYDGVKGFVGTTGYLIRLVDANNTYFSSGIVYGVPDKSLSLATNDGLTATVGTTNGTGFTFATIVYPNNDTRNITLSFAGDTDYNGYTKEYDNVKIMYLTNITYFVVNFIDNNGNGFVDTGDQLDIHARVMVRDSTDSWVPAPNGLTVVIKIFSDPLEISATTSGGWANVTYTTTGSEGLVGTGHIARVYGDGSTTWVYDPTLTELSLPYNFNLAPTPELPILPIIVLAAVMLLLLVKRRK